MRFDIMAIQMFIGMFIIQYVFSSYIMTNSIGNITHSVGKIYMSTIMGLFMVLMSIIMNHKFNLQQFLFFCTLLLIFIILYKLQFGVGDKNYLQEMIEHHSMALLTSQKILEKTKAPAVANFATHILITQEKEIEDMKYLLKSI